MVKCLICKREIIDGDEHLLKYLDKKHILAYEKFLRTYNNYDGNCFMCGGKIKTFAVGNEGWVTKCTCCDFIYNED